MAAIVELGEALMLGLASGPACVAACGPVLVPSLLAERAGLSPHLRYLAAFLGARLVGYLIFGAVAWEIGALAVLPPGGRVLLMGTVNLLLAGVLAWYAYSAKSFCGSSCAKLDPASKLIKIGAAPKSGAGAAAALGLLTGLSLCPPFIAAGVRAAELGSLMQALLFFACFFVGTSVWFVPFVGMGCIARNQAVTTVARMAMALIALYYLASGIVLLIGRKAYGY